MWSDLSDVDCQTCLDFVLEEERLGRLTRRAQVVGSTATATVAAAAAEHHWEHGR